MLLQNSHQRLPDVTTRVEPCTRKDVADFAAQQRYFRRMRVVNFRREEPKETLFPLDLAVCIDALYPYVIEVSRPVHCCPRIRFGDHQKLRDASEFSNFRGRRSEAHRDLGLFCLAQYPEARTQNDAQDVLAVLIDQIVIATSEKCEMTICQPG